MVRIFSADVRDFSTDFDIVHNKDTCPTHRDSNVVYHIHHRNLLAKRQGFFVHQPILDIPTSHAIFVLLSMVSPHFLVLLMLLTITIELY